MTAQGERPSTLYEVTMQSFDLRHIFGEIASAIPSDPMRDDDFLFHAGVLPVPQGLLSTDRVIVRKEVHEYNSWYRADLLRMFVSLQTSRELGVFILSCLFHGPAETVTLELTNPASEIRRIIVPSVNRSLDDPLLGLTVVPHVYRYFPESMSRYPWSHRADVRNLPLLALSNWGESVTTDEQWRARDSIFQRSSMMGTALLAELFLNAGCTAPENSEYWLEGEAGNRGVAPTSAELCLVLPGSFPWIYEGDDVP
jgi:hypothetical protein